MGTSLKELFDRVIANYNVIKSHELDLLNSTFSEALLSLATECSFYLNGVPRVALVSKVKDKQYFSFAKGTKLSRPIRIDLFEDDVIEVHKFLEALRLNNFNELTETAINKSVYTVAVGFCAIIDLEKVGDQKTPGTFFEYFAGHLVSKRFTINPKRAVNVLNLDKSTSLPTDLIYDFGANKPKFHVPVKTSTRERVIQVWAHQRVIDGIYGAGRFTGILISLSETKLNKTNLEVVEICLPQQWQIYQMFIAQMKRVYYLDLPAAYAALSLSYPKIFVKSFSDFILESSDIDSLA